MFYNTYRTTKAANSERLKLGQTGQSILANPRKRLINLQKRQKLKDLLITKFMQKYGIKHPEFYLENEINKFLQGEKLNDVDLQRLDAKIHRMLQAQKNLDTLHNSLNNSMNGNLNSTMPIIQNNLNQTRNDNNLNSHERSVTEGMMSQTTRQNNQNEKYPKFKNPREELAWLEAEEAKYEKKTVEKEKIKNPHERVDFSATGDEWGALAEYNRRIYLQDIKEEKMKDYEIKRRTKEDLDIQVKEKLKREYEEELRNKEYARIWKEHLKDIDEIERKKQEEMHQQRLREQSNRINQMRDEYCRKRIEELKNKKWERNLVKHYKEEIEADRKAAQEKKEKEYAAYQKTKEINELREKKLADDLLKEKEEDKKFCEENKIIEDRKERERELYFKKIRRNGNKYDLTEANKIANQIKEDIKEEDDKINFYMREKNKKEIEQENNKLRKKKIDERNELKHQLDLQIEEKQKYNELEKELDNEQARIWNTDCKKFNDDKKEIERKIRRMNEKNLEHLKKQIQFKHDKEKNKYRMSDNEYAMNKNTIMKIKELNDKLPEAA